MKAIRFIRDCLTSVAFFYLAYLAGVSDNPWMTGLLSGAATLWLVALAIDRGDPQ